jgi:hypothetical protein
MKWESEISAHPESPFDVVTGVRPERIGVGQGLLEIRLHSGARAGVEGRGPALRAGPGGVRRYSLPGVPLLLIDSRPVVQGVGKAWVRLPPGTHRCSVQAGGFAGWWTVEIESDRVAVLQARPERAWRQWQLPPLLPDRFAEKVRYWTALFYLPFAFAITLMLSIVPSWLVDMFAPGLVEEEPGRTIALGVFTAFVLGLWITMTAHHVGTMRRTKCHLRTQAALAAAPQYVSGLPVHELPVTATEVPASESGAGGILLDLAWEAVWQRPAEEADTDRPAMRDSGESSPAAGSPWIADPTVVIGEFEVPVTWGRWWIPLPAGWYPVEVAIAKQGEGAAEVDDDGYVTWDDTVEVASGWVTHLRLDGSAVQYDYADGRSSLRLTGFEYIGRSYQTGGRLVGFHRPRLEVDSLEGQTDPR